MKGRGPFNVARALTAAALLALVWAAILLVWSSHAPHVRRYIHSPVPQGVNEMSFTSNDKFGLSIEWSAHLAFNAPAAAMKAVIRTGGFRVSSLEFASGVPGRPAEWPGPQSLGPDAQAYFRVHKPRLDGRFLRRFLPFGANRRWSEVLVIDSTGTNGFFTMWNTD